MTRITLETKVAEAYRGLASIKNTSRIWVPASETRGFATTGSAQAFVLTEVSTGLISMQDPSLAANEDWAFIANFPAEFSDLAAEGGGSAVDRGVRVIGCEVLWDTDAALTDVTVTLHRMTLLATGTLPTVAAITTSFDSAHDTTAERLTADEHRMQVTVAERDRFFMDGESVVVARVEFVNAASTPQVDFYGVLWHFERVAE